MADLTRPDASRRAWGHVLQVLLLMVVWASRGEAGTGQVVVSATGTVKEMTGLTVRVVTQGDSADPDDVISFDDDGDPQENTLRNSHEALRIEFNSNPALGRLIISTDNTSSAAHPRFCGNPATGDEGGGLVGTNNCTQRVPLLWRVSDDNIAATFTLPVGDNENFVTDKAHVATFTSIFKQAETQQRMDGEPLVRCADRTPVANLPGDHLYPQVFGHTGSNADLCHPDGTPEPFAQELSKNIAIIASNVKGTIANVPQLDTPCDIEQVPPDPNCGDTVSMTSPIYLALAADFTGKSAQRYATNTLTIELIQQ